MILRLFSLALFVVPIAPRLLCAQSGTQLPSDTGAPYSWKGQQFYTWQKPAVYDPTNYDKMYEDIEVMRRILDRQLQPLYPSHTYETFGMAGLGGMGGMRGMSPGMPGMSSGMGLGGGGGMADLGGIGGLGGGGGAMGMASGTTTAVIPFRSLEGVYLKGQGVVYTATLSSLQSPKKSVKTEAAKPVSEWDSVRRQVRNEKEESKKSEASKPPTLSDVLLKVLAENGHHFSQLGENEGLTIVLTVHQQNPSSSSRKTKGGRGSGGSPKKASTKPESGGGSDLRGKVSDLELLGDLHQKQSKYLEAIPEYLKAVELGPDANAAPTLYRKLAQCYLALGQDDKAQKMLDQIRALLKEPADGKDTTASADKPAAALPVKLIVSAPKKLLQQAKEGKITFEEFRRQARVETVGVANSAR